MVSGIGLAPATFCSSTLASYSTLRFGAVGADLEAGAVEPLGVGDELHPPGRLELTVAGVDDDGEDAGHLGPRPAACAEARVAPEHDQARPLLDRGGQEVLLILGQE